MKISSSCKMFAIVALLAAGVGLSTTSVSARAPQAQSATSKQYTVKASIVGANNKTVLLVAKTGRVLASKKITSNTSTAVTLTTPSKPKITTLAGATLQLVSSTSGDYFGPILLGWYGSSRTSASKVYTKFSSSAPTTIDLKTITIVNNGPSSTKQGYGYTAKNTASTTIDTASASATKAASGKPKGVGNYGKAKTTSASSLFVTGNRSPMFCPPTCPGPPAEGGGGGAKVDVDDLDGGDADDDGIPNAFDVNDDGDAKVDSADSDTPEPNVTGSSTDAATCEAAASFHIFTNYKATAPNFADTLNFYGTGSHAATDASIFTQVAASMSMVFSPITQVCSETVTKMEIKGVGVSYAPTDYAEVTAGGTGDIQWQIGAGTINNVAATGFTAQTFTTRASLPSGQDTFIQRVTTTSGKVYEFTATAGFVFVTHPMLQGYCVKTTTDTTSCVSGSDFTQINYAASSIPTISVGSTQTLLLRMYRPQRFAIDGEAPGFYNLGGFKYTPDMPNPPGGRTDGNNFGKCDGATYPDGEMTTDTLANSSDSAVTSTLQVSWNLKACFDDKDGKSWSTGTVTIDIQVESPGPGGNSAQKLFLTLT